MITTEKISGNATRPGHVQWRNKSFFLLLVSGIVVILHSSAWAKRPLDGFYIGAQGEYANLHLSGNYQLVPPAKVTDKTDIDWRSNRTAIGLTAGWGGYADNIYLGLGFDYSMYTNKIDEKVATEGQTGTSFSFDITNKFKMQLAGIVGYGLSDELLAYGKAGLTYTNINVEATSMTPSDGTYQGAVHDWIGGVAGIGIAYNLLDNIALKVEYNYTTYFWGPKYDNDKNDGEKTDYTFSDHRVIAGVVYTF